MIRRTAADPELIWLIPAGAIVALVWLTAAAAAEINGISALPLAAGYLVTAARAVPAMLLVALLIAAGRAIREGERSPARRMAQALRANLRTPWQVVAAFAPPVAMAILLGAFGTLKVLLPRYTPFVHDGLFAALDWGLFLGHDPWRLTHALFGSAGATLFLDRLYTLWVFLLPVSILWFALFARRPERARYFLSMILVWTVLGVLGAYAGSSAGPAFLASLGHADAPHYAGLMARLHAIDAAAGEAGLDAVRWQAVLWRAHVHGDLAFGMGISAMPSLHNAVATLYALAAFRFGRWQGAAATLFAVVIFVGSIHLGWHYAVDGIASALAVAVLWFGVGRYLRATGYDALAAREAATAPAGRAASLAT